MVQTKQIHTYNFVCVKKMQIILTHVYAFWLYFKWFAKTTIDRAASQYVLEANTSIYMKRLSANIRVVCVCLPTANGTTSFQYNVLLCVCVCSSSSSSSFSVFLFLYFLLFICISKLMIHITWTESICSYWYIAFANCNGKTHNHAISKWRHWALSFPMICKI